MSNAETCDLCKAEGKWAEAVASFDPRGSDDNPWGLCKSHLAEFGRAAPAISDDEEQVQCTWPGCGKLSKNKRALQSHISRHKRMKREAAAKTTALSEAQ